MLRYPEVDVRILADAFEEFRRMNLLRKGLGHVHFVIFPVLSFMCAFKTDEGDMWPRRPHLLRCGRRDKFESRSDAFCSAQTFYRDKGY